MNTDLKREAGLPASARTKNGGIHAEVNIPPQARKRLKEPDRVMYESKKTTAALIEPDTAILF